MENNSSSNIRSGTVSRELNGPTPSWNEVNSTYNNLHGMRSSSLTTIIGTNTEKKQKKKSSQYQRDNWNELFETRIAVSNIGMNQSQEAPEWTSYKTREWTTYKTLEWTTSDTMEWTSVKTPERISFTTHENGLVSRDINLDQFRDT